MIAPGEKKNGEVGSKHNQRKIRTSANKQVLHRCHCAVSCSVLNCQVINYYMFLSLEEPVVNHQQADIYLTSSFCHIKVSTLKANKEHDYFQLKFVF